MPRSLPDDSRVTPLETLYSFCATQSCPDGDQPYAGGSNGDGAVFELKNKGGKKYALHYLHSFDNNDGA
ncbi:MAG TPA: hypothetical protein VKR31_02535, partial [Rhizomicrobium sp.]|nr:hypothetical protein [Rhizomicrobium sp.]